MNIIYLRVCRSITFVIRALSPNNNWGKTLVFPQTPLALVRVIKRFALVVGALPPHPCFLLSDKRKRKALTLRERGILKLLYNYSS